MIAACRMCLCVSLSAATGAWAQAWPAKPVRFVMPFPVGGPSDIVGRALGQKLGEQLGVNIVPDNRVGAGGGIGVAHAAKSAPDGYTWLLTAPAIAIIPALTPQAAQFDYARDFAPVARLAAIPNVLLVHPSVPTRTLKDFVALARSQPGKLNYGSGGAGTTNHLANELLMSLQKIRLVHVPYKGASVAVHALIGGEVDEVIVAVAPALPHIRSGRVRPLAVLSESRVASLPEVPTAIEGGVPGFVMVIWYGLYAPAGTPADLVARMNREVVRAIGSADLKARFDAAGVEPWPGTPQEIDALTKSETARYAALIGKAGIRAD